MTRALDLARQTQLRLKNYLINPCGVIRQEALGARTDGQYDFDQWITLTQTGAVTVSALDDVEDGLPSMMRSLQAQASAQRFGRIQWIERSFCRNLRNKNATLAARVRVSAAATLRYAIIAWSGTADTITKDVVADWNSSSFTPGGFFNSASITIVASGALALAANVTTDLPPITGLVPSQMNNLAVFFWTQNAQAQNFTLDIANTGVYRGRFAPEFEMPDEVASFNDCARYFLCDPQGETNIFSSAVSNGSGYYHPINFTTMMRVPPDVVTGVGPSYGLFPTQAPTVLNRTVRGFRVSMVANNSGGGYFTYTWTASARL